MSDHDATGQGGDHPAQQAILEVVAAVEQLAAVVEEALAGLPDTGIDAVTALPRVRMHTSQARALIETEGDGAPAAAG